MDHVLLLQNPMGIIRICNSPLTSIFRVSRDFRHMAFDRLLHVGDVFLQHVSALLTVYQNFTFILDCIPCIEAFDNFMFGSSETNYFNHHTFGGKHAREHIRSFGFEFCRPIMKRRSPWDALELVQCYPNATHVAIAFSSEETTKFPVGDEDPDDPFEQYDVDTVMDNIDIDRLLELPSLKELMINYFVEEVVVDYDEGREDLNLLPLMLVRDLQTTVRHVLQRNQRCLPQGERRDIRVPVYLSSDTVRAWSRMMDDGEDWIDIVAFQELSDEAVMPCAGFIGC